GRPRQHGALARGQGAAARPRGGGVRRVAAGRPQAPARRGQVHLQASAGRDGADRDHRAAEDGLLHPAGPLAPSLAARNLRGARGCGAGLRAVVPRSGADQEVVGAGPARDARLRDALVGPPRPGVLGRRLHAAMKILVFSSLCPNNAAPQRGLFVKQRMAHVAALEGHAIKVIAPVPYYPPIALGWRQRFARVDRHEVIDGVDVYHPRYLMTPKIGMTLYGLLMFLAARPVARSIQRTFDFDLIDAHF